MDADRAVRLSSGQTRFAVLKPYLDQFNAHIAAGQQSHGYAPLKP